MVRRLSKKPKASKQKQYLGKKSASKLARWETVDDIPLEEEDACERGIRLTSLS